MSAALEAQYRQGLRWYSRSWRAENADAIVGTMLDQADADGRSTPLPGELRNLARSGVSTRIEAIAPQAVRDRVATIALALGFASSLVMFVFHEWAPFAATGPWNDWALPPQGDSFTVPSTIGFGPFASATTVIYAMWIVAFGLVTLRFSRSAIVVILATVPVLLWVHYVANYDWPNIHQSGISLVVLAGLALLVAIGRPARVGRLPIAVAVAIASVVIAFVIALIPTSVKDGRLWAEIPAAMLNAPLLWLIMLLGGIVLALAHKRGWAAALLVSSTPWAALSSLFLGINLVAFVVAAVVTVLSIVGAAKVWRHRPAPTETA